MAQIIGLEIKKTQVTKETPKPVETTKAAPKNAAKSDKSKDLFTK